MYSDFIKERNEALLSLDKEKIYAYAYKYDIKFPDNEKDFWAGIHKAICNLYRIPVNNISKEEYERSKKWLEENNYTTNIK